jgi:hypothetical protein
MSCIFELFIAYILLKNILFGLFYARSLVRRALPNGFLEKDLKYHKRGKIFGRYGCTWGKARKIPLKATLRQGMISHMPIPRSSPSPALLRSGAIEHPLAGEYRGEQ